MATFTETWDATYETLPPDTGEAVSLGAGRIRSIKEAVSEREKIDHSWAGDGNDGKHNKATLRIQEAKPTLDATDGAIYAKEISTVTELFYEDDTAVEVQLTSAGSLLSFPVGTKMLFQQTAAPTGWTKDTTHNNKALRVVTGTASSGGATGFSSVFGSSKVTGSTAPGTDSTGAHTHTAVTGSEAAHTHAVTVNSHTLTTAEMPAHNHDIKVSTTDTGGATSFLKLSTTVSVTDTNTTWVQNEGGGGGHTHTAPASGAGSSHNHSISSDGGHTHTVNSHTHALSLDLQFVDLIIATKD